MNDNTIDITFIKNELIQRLKSLNPVKIILFGSVHCLYHCNRSICYKWFSENMREDYTPVEYPCNNAHRREEVRKLTRFNLDDERFNGYFLFKFKSF